jgi:hypothetical protein
MLNPTDNADRTFVIVGTAPTWKLAPWKDPKAVIAGLNDAYLLGMPRYDVWYDLHPFDKFFYRPLAGPKKVQGYQVPAGTFVRPEGHLQWLAKQTCPVFLQQADPRVPHGQALPRPTIEAHFGHWFDSSPAWMLAHALLLGFKHVVIVGIHLASEAEYIKQKPNMCYLVGVARGSGVRVDVPAESPLLQSSHTYAFEDDPSTPVLQVQRTAEGLQVERQKVEALWQASKSWRYPKGDPVLASRRAWLDAQLLDLKHAVEWETLKKRARTAAQV